MTRSREEGAAVVVVLLIILTMTALAQGTLLLARVELGVARAGADHLRSRAAADAALALAAGQAIGHWADSVARWDSRTTVVTQVGGVSARGRLRRLAGESWLIEGIAHPEGRSPVRSGVITWALDPLIRVTALHAAVTVGPGAPIEVEGPVDTSGPLERRPPLGQDACQAWEPELSRTWGRRPLAAVLAADSLGPRLGQLDLESLLRRSAPYLAGAGVPTPVDRSGTCDVSALWNWGDPEAPGGPCSDHLALRGSIGDVTVDGGVGQGMLVVAGDITFRNGARFYGLVLAGGQLALHGGAALEGLAIAQRGLRLTRDGRVHASVCWALRALGAARESLGSPLMTPGIGPIGPG